MLFVQQILQTLALAVTLAVVTVGLAACGQTGALYLPTPPEHPSTVPASP